MLEKTEYKSQLKKDKKKAWNPFDYMGSLFKGLMSQEPDLDDGYPKEL